MRRCGGRKNIWAWSETLKQLGGTMLAVPVECKHAVEAGKFV